MHTPKVAKPYTNVIFRDALAVKVQRHKPSTSTNVDYKHLSTIVLGCQVLPTCYNDADITWMVSMDVTHIIEHK